MKAALFKPAASLALCLTVAFSLAACRTPKQAVETAGPEQHVVKDTDEPTKAIPPDLYKSMPIYPGAEVIHVRKPKGAMREIFFQLKNAPGLDQMVNFYKDGLKKGDFKITSSLIMRARKTWSCDFHKEGRPGSVMLYPDDHDKSTTVIDLIYEMPSKIDEAMLEPKEDFDVIGPGPAGNNPSEVKKVSNSRKGKAKRN
jgi:hypothetical protein